MVLSSSFTQVNVFAAHTLRCHFNCSIKSTPSFDEMDEESSYELDEMTLDFNAYDFVLVKSCKLDFNEKLNIVVNCEKKELQGKYSIIKFSFFLENRI